MADKYPRFTRQHFEFVADFFGPLMGHPSDINRMADHLDQTNPNFKRDMFLDRAVTAWEDKHITPHEDHQSMIDGKDVA